MSVELTKCRICGSKAEESSLEPAHGRSVRCPVCGNYELSFQAEPESPPPEIQDRLYLLSAFLRHHVSADGKEFTVLGKHLSSVSDFDAEIASGSPSTVSGKALALLDWITQCSPHYGAEVKVLLESDYPMGYCRNSQELKFCLHFLADQGLIRRSEPYLNPPAEDVMLTASGWDEAEGRKRALGRKICFVAMWFDPQMAPAYLEGIKPLTGETGIDFVRVDQEQFNDKICDKVIADIRRSRFVIADTTGHRLAVHFEAGFAMGLGLPVIWTCRKGDFKPDTNFDIRQYNHIVWETPEELRQKLLDRIRATLPGLCGHAGAVDDQK